MLALLHLLVAAAAPPAAQQADIASAPPPPFVGRPHNCASWYPPISIRSGEEGDVQVRFTITTDGMVKGISVAKSSGHDALDQAAVLCVATWHYKPAMQDGTPVEAPWQAVVKFHLDGPPFTLRNLERDGYRCVAASMPDNDEMQRASNGTGIDITLKAGAITDVEVFRSSGNQNLDALALRCFRSVKVDPEDAKDIASEPNFRFYFTWNLMLIRALANQALPESR